MKVKVTWEERTLKYLDATIHYRLPGLPVFLELRSKFGQTMSEDAFLGATKILIEFLLWMIVDWDNVEKDTTPPQPIPFSKDYLRNILEHDGDFRSAMLKGTDLLEHLSTIQIGHKEKTEDDTRNLKIVATYWWQIAAAKNGVEIHGVNIDGTLYMKDAIRTNDNNNETFRIISMIDSLKMDFLRTVELYQTTLQDTFTPEHLYELQEKVQYVRNIWSGLGAGK